ncbi:MAG: hypothetical protein JXR76_02635 [Deltaproteobacteria bacterium]|nr:hypothetical protein [Deltaproteobacteria bacterium]
MAGRAVKYAHQKWIYNAGDIEHLQKECKFSYAAGTALATGHKVDNGVVGKDRQTDTPLTTMAEKAHRRGMKMAILSSVSILRMPLADIVAKAIEQLAGKNGFFKETGSHYYSFKGLYKRMEYRMAENQKLKLKQGVAGVFFCGVCTSMVKSCPVYICRN